MKPKEIINALEPVKPTEIVKASVKPKETVHVLDIVKEIEQKKSVETVNKDSFKTASFPPLNPVSNPSPPIEVPTISSSELFVEDINKHLDQDAELLRDFNRIKNEKFHERTTDFDSEPSFEEEEIEEDVVAESEPDEFELSDLITTDRTVSPTWKTDAFDHYEAVLKK